ncbi:winged helix-turn-helix domain-containing protein [Thalassospira sp. MBR-102]|uniref:winged helix-turn-helix domain-containing protein n=1 Tax=Thalassospira sp. MBR-102 TaxID=3156466 RepID=UPI003394DAEE
MFIGDTDYASHASNYLTEFSEIYSTAIRINNLSHINDVARNYTLLVLCQETNDQDLFYPLFQKIDIENKRRSVIVHGKISDDLVIDVLNAGAINCISAQESFPVVAAKIKSALRTVIATSHYVIQIGRFLYDSSHHTLLNISNGDKIKVQNRQNQILKYMVRNKGRLVTVRELQRNIWGYHAEIDTHAVETGVYRLRKKIERNHKDPKILIRKGEGYILSQTPNISNIPIRQQPEKYEEMK